MHQPFSLHILSSTGLPHPPAKVVCLISLSLSLSLSLSRSLLDIQEIGSVMNCVVLPVSETTMFRSFISFQCQRFINIYIIMYPSTMNIRAFCTYKLRISLCQNLICEQGRIQEVAHRRPSESLILAPWSKVEECRLYNLPSIWRP